MKTIGLGALVWVSIPQMARTHGVVNALGLSVCGLLGWRLTEREPCLLVNG